MLSKVLSTLLFVSLLVSTTAKFTCNGTELSVSNDVEIGLLTEKPCTHVYGNIVIENLSNAKRMPTYWTVQELHGSLIIRNTTKLADSVNLQNLRKIVAYDAPAIVLENNKKLRLAIGARLGEVTTHHRITYWFQNNWPAFMTESQHYTLYKAANAKRPVFYTDNHFITSECPEMNYVLWTFVFGLFSFVVSMLLFMCACLGRPHEKITKIN